MNNNSHVPQNSKKIGFIGAGNMASALVRGMIANNMPPESIMLSDINNNQLNTLSHQLGVKTTTSNERLIKACDIVVIAVKPQLVHDIIQPLASTFQQKSTLIISIVAGITIESLDLWTDGGSAIIRCMPNTPALLKLGASGLYANALVTDAQKQQAQDILQAVGSVEWLSHETQIDAVTALSGSGPAYYFLMMEAMIQAGKDLGLSEQSAKALTLQTALGAATMAMKSDIDEGVDVQELRRRVTSPNGTTEAAINNFQENNFEGIISDAMQAAKLRSEQLAQE